MITSCHQCNLVTIKAGAFCAQLSLSGCLHTDHLVCHSTSWVLQAMLVEQIGSMLTSFTQRKTEEVSRTVAGLHSQLDTGRNAVGSSFAELGTLSTAAAGHLQVWPLSQLSDCSSASKKMKLLGNYNRSLCM